MKVIVTHARTHARTHWYYPSLYLYIFPYKIISDEVYDRL